MIVVGKWPCCVQYSERLVFMLARKPTVLTKVPWLFLVFPDKHRVRIFLKWHKLGLANMRPTRKVFAALGHLNSLSNTV
jgi:hypothetical protein